MTMLKKKAAVWMLLVDMIDGTLTIMCRMQLFSREAVGSAASEVALYRERNRV